MLAALLLSLQTAPDIVVTAARERERAVVSRQVEAVLPPAPSGTPYARFATPVCPGVSGLARTSAQAVVDRIGVVADSVGLAVGEPGCTPNLLVLVVPNGAATVKRTYPRQAGPFVSQSIRDIRRIIAEPGGARGWIETEVRSRDGDPLGGAPGEIPELGVQGPSRVALSFRRDIVSAVVVIDAAAARGRDPNQIADYAAIRGLTGARPAARGRAASVLSAFTPGADATAPTALTAFDRGILAGLYRGQGNVDAGGKRGQIVDAVLEINR